ncbi:MAG: hypothetical protein Q9196_005101 [Gyalolechia fulgens]
MKNLGKLTASWAQKYQLEKDETKGELRSMRDLLCSMMVYSQLVVFFAAPVVQAYLQTAFADHLLFITHLSFGYTCISMKRITVPSCTPAYGNGRICPIPGVHHSTEGYHIFDSKINLESNPTARVSHSRKRRRSGYSEINVGPDTKRVPAAGKYLECLHLRISLLEDLFNNASPQAGHDSQRTPETLGIGERVAGLEKINCINHYFRTTLRDSLGNFCCPAEECDRSYKTAADLHVHTRGKPGNGYNILKRIINRTYCIRWELQCWELQCNRPRDLQRHEKASHGEAYDLRIVIFLGCLTQDTPQEPLVDQTRISAANSGPTQNLNTLSNQASQPKTSFIESCNVLANCIGSQSFINNYGSQASDASFTPALTLRANEDNQSYISLNNATPESDFPFEMAPIQ